jgi:hypothetical protein
VIAEYIFIFMPVVIDELHVIDVLLRETGDASLILPNT